jgi:thiosulfate/3-mercaptopyruvate sulfurtransferase
MPEQQPEQAGQQPQDGRTVPPLVSDEWLAEHYKDPDVVVLEVDEEPGVYYGGHIPGAHKLDWVDDLHHPLQRSFIEGEAFGQLMDRLGVGNDCHVVLCGDANNFFAASAYWLLRYNGHARVSLLDGGRRWWVRQGRELVDDEPTVQRRPRYVVEGRNPEFRATRDQVLERYLGAPDGTILLDCRTPGEYDGSGVDTTDLPVERHRAVGHIPGAVNLSTTLLVDESTGRLQPLEQLRRLYADRGVREDSDVTVYCRVAERSALLWFVLHELLEHPHVRNYDGGWAEYGSLMDVPVER